MGDAIKLVGIVIVIIGFALKFDTLATVVVAGIVTGLVGGMSIMIFYQHLELLSLQTVQQHYLF